MHPSTKSLTFAISLALFGSTAGAAVFGEPAQIESTLASRTDIVFHGGFEGDAPASAAWNAAWGIAFNNRLANSTIVTGPDAVAGAKAIRIDYPKGGVGPNATGMQFPIAFSKIAGMVSAYDSLYLRYYVYFEPGFDWVKGGKLPGLMGGGSSWGLSGGNIPDGTKGWTLRFMWRSAGKAVVYAYLPPSKYQVGVWGTDIPMDASFQTGKWHCIEQFVKVNTIGKSDGKLYAWLDGKRVLTLDDVLYRTVDNPEGKVGGIYVSTFHGGNTADWAPSVTSHARFDGFVAGHSRIGSYDELPPSLSIRTAGLDTGLAGFSYRKVLEAENGTGPYRWNLVSGALPAGLTLDADGNLAGRPVVAGAFPIQVQVTDAKGATTRKGLEVVVQPSEGRNLANALTITGHSPELDLGNPVRGLWDGVLDGSASASPGSQTTESLWFEFDLQSSVTLSKVRLYGDPDGAWNCDTYRVQTRVGGVDPWVDLVGSSTCKANQWFETPTTTTARHVRLEIKGTPGSSKSQVKEFEVYGTLGGTSGIHRGTGSSTGIASRRYRVENDLVTFPGAIFQPSALWAVGIDGRTHPLDRRGEGFVLTSLPAGLYLLRSGDRNTNFLGLISRAR